MEGGGGGGGWERKRGRGKGGADVGGVSGGGRSQVESKERWSREKN